MPTSAGTAKVEPVSPRPRRLDRLITEDRADIRVDKKMGFAFITHQSAHRLLLRNTASVPSRLARAPAVAEWPLTLFHTLCICHANEWPGE